MDQCAAAMRIGSDETDIFFTSLVDYMRVYDQALIAREIAALANQ